MNKIEASGNLHGHELTDIPILNRGVWFGKTWLIEIGGSDCSLFRIVEVKSICNAIEELEESVFVGSELACSLDTVELSSHQDCDL